LQKDFCCVVVVFTRLVDQLVDAGGDEFLMLKGILDAFEG